MIVLQLVVYAAAMIFIVMMIARVYRIANSPPHLRWELYPVPHEKGRASYGGSRLEETDWWTKKQDKDDIGELAVMIPEILLLKGVWEHNKKLWSGSYPFHVALYLIIGNIALMVLAAILNVAGIEPIAGATTFVSVLHTAIEVIAWAAAVIGGLGAIRLLLSRIVEERLRIYSTASHFFNIILIGAIYFTGLFWLIRGGFVNGSIGFFKSVITFSAMPELPGIAVAHIALSAVFLAYFPFTHMTHMVTKYFTYHKVRWEDEAIKPGGKMATKISEYLNQPVTWAAPHIGADGRKNWLAIASELPPKEEKK